MFPDESDVMTICAPRNAQPHRNAEQSGGDADTSSSFVVQVAPSSLDLLTKRLTFAFAPPLPSYPAQAKKISPLGVTVPPPASDQPSLPFWFTFTSVNVNPPSWEFADQIVCEWL